MIIMREYDFIPDTEEQHVEGMKLSIANSILSKRLDDIALEPNSTYFRTQWQAAWLRRTPRPAFGQRSCGDNGTGDPACNRIWFH
jgi:hypothetical protein